MTVSIRVHIALYTCLSFSHVQDMVIQIQYDKRRVDVTIIKNLVCNRLIGIHRFYVFLISISLDDELSNLIHLQFIRV